MGKLHNHPLWLAIDAAVVYLKTDRQRLWQYDPTFAGGLNMDRINTAAISTRVTSEPIISVVQRPVDGRDSIEKIVVCRPPFGTEVRCTLGGVGSYPANFNLADLFIERLSAWQGQIPIHPLPGGGNLPPAGRPRKTINDRMREAALNDPALVSLTAQQWAEKLGCSAGTVKGTNFWKTIMQGRAMAAIDRARGQGLDDSDDNDEEDE